MATVPEMPRHEQLTRVLNTYRAAMQRHIAGELQQAWGSDWFNELRSRLPEQQQRELQANQRAMDLHRSKGLLRISAGDEQLMLLDIPLFLFIVRHQEHVFGALTEQEQLEKMIKLYEYRNVWAHPGASDIAQGTLWQAAQLAEDVLGVFDGEAAAAVREAVQERVSPMEGIDRFEPIEEPFSETHVDKSTYDAALATYETVTRIEAEIAALSVATERQQSETRVGLWQDLSELMRRQHSESQAADGAAAQRAEHQLANIAETAERVESELRELRAYTDHLSERLAILERVYLEIRDAVHELNARLDTARTNVAIIWAKCKREFRAAYEGVVTAFTLPSRDRN